MTTTALDRFVHRAHANFAQCVADRDVVKVDLQNVADYQAEWTFERAGRRPLPIDPDEFGCVMWPWTSSIAYWRTTARFDTLVADYVALVRADHEHHTYDSLVFRARPHASHVEFVTCGYIQCHPDGRRTTSATPRTPSERWRRASRTSTAWWQAQLDR